MAFSYQITWPAASQNGISSLVGAAINTALPLTNATTVPDIRAGTSSSQYSFGNNILRKIALFSATDYSLTAFTITGLDNLGVAQSEVIAAGPNNTTVYSAKDYLVLYSVTPSTLVANVSIGWGGGTTNLIPLNTLSNVASYSFGWQTDANWTDDTAIIPKQVLGLLVEWTKDNLGPRATYPSVALYPWPTFLIKKSLNNIYQDSLTRSAVVTTVANPAAAFNTNTGTFTWVILQQGAVNS